MPGNLLVPRVGIRNAGGWFMLPPYNMSVTLTERATIDVRNIPHAPAGGLTMRTAFAGRIGWDIDVEFHYRKGSIYDGWQFQSGLRDALCAPDTFRYREGLDFCRFADALLSVKGTFRGCVCTMPPQFGAGLPGTEAVRRCAFKLTSGYPAIYTTGAAGDVPPTNGAYEAVYYKEVIGTGLPYHQEDPDPPEAQQGEGNVPIDQAYIVNATFAGLAEVTDANNWTEQQFAVPVAGSGVAVMKIMGFRLQALSGRSGAGATTAKVSDQAWNNQSGATTATGSIAAGANDSGWVTCEIPITLDGNGNGTAYVFFSAAGGHAGVTAALKLVSA
jgi:hypothetical protein